MSPSSSRSLGEMLASRLSDSSTLLPDSPAEKSSFASFFSTRGRPFLSLGLQSIGVIAGIQPFQTVFSFFKSRIACSTFSKSLNSPFPVTTISSQPPVSLIQRKKRPPAFKIGWRILVLTNSFFPSESDFGSRR